MRCCMCSHPLGVGAMSLTLFTDRADTINLCTSCRHQLLGPEVDTRVSRLVRLKGWVQPELPHLTGI